MDKLIKQAFTLIELLVVIAIIGILSGLIIVSIGVTTQKAVIAKAQIFSNSLRNSLMINIVSEWKLDDISGAAAADNWNGGNTGTLVNFTSTDSGYGDTGVDGWMTSANCVFGTCLKFDGVDDYVNINIESNLSLTEAITVEAWVFPTSFVSTPTILGKNTFRSGYILGGPYSSSSNGAWFWLGNGTTVVQASSPKGVPLNQWTYLAVTAIKNGNIIVYKNGEAGTPVAVSTWIIPSGKNFRIGRGSDGNYDTPFIGVIDEIRVYSTTMTSLQIRERYFIGLNKLFINGSISQLEYIKRINETI